MNNDTCFRRSQVCYLLSVVVFVVWIAASFMAIPGEGRVREALREFLADRVIDTRVVVEEDGNPAPSVVLEVTSAPWCAPCQRIKPTLRQLQEEGYRIEITETPSPTTPVPHFNWKHFGESERTHNGVQGYPNLKKVEAYLRKTFAEIEGSVFEDSNGT